MTRPSGPNAVAGLVQSAVMRQWALALSSCLLACSAAGDESSPATDDDSAMTDNPQCRGDGPLAVHFSTADGVRLTADLHPGAGTGGPAVVLLHMNPEGNDNRNFPPELVDGLNALSLTVLNVNRRGAGGSEGTARDAFEGPLGVQDAIAAQSFLVEHCSSNASAMVFVGASNGTTTALDFLVASSADPAIPSPRGLVFLSAGEYTENQHAIADNLELVKSIPVLWAYPQSEAAYHDALAADPGAQWQFTEYAGGSHGTGLFSSNPESVQQVADFVGVTLDVGMGW